MAKNDGGSAFPATRWDDNIRQEVPWCGMTLREALQAEPEKPVACILTKDGIPLDTWLEDDVIAQIQCGGYRRDDYIVVPLYTAPPSIDALISEIDAETPYSSFYAERIKGILNKYKPESITLNAL